MPNLNEKPFILPNHKAETEDFHLAPNMILVSYPFFEKSKIEIPDAQKAKYLEEKMRNPIVVKHTVHENMISGIQVGDRIYLKPGYRSNPLIQIGDNFYTLYDAHNIGMFRKLNRAERNTLTKKFNTSLSKATTLAEA